MDSSKKVLVIGCDFSSGSYETKQSDKIGSMPTDELVSSIGWYDHIDCLNGRSVDVYSMPGLGWMAYAHFLRGLRDAGKLDQYDLLIVQETFEPCFGLLGNQFQSEFIKSPTVDRKLDVQHWRYRGSPKTMIMTCDEMGIAFYKDFVSKNIDAHTVPRIVADEVLADIAASEYMRTLIAASQSLACAMLAERGIRMITVSFSNKHLENAENIATDVYSDLCLPNREEYLTIPTKDPGSRGGRLTASGNEKLGVRFNTILKSYLS